jgi:hypothetical protein
MALIAAGLLLLVVHAAPAAPPPAPPPSDAECVGLPALQLPLAFTEGESLDFKLDAMGAEAGTMTMKVLPPKEGQLPIQVEAQTNTFFAKIRRVKGLATSYMHPKTLRPSRYTEDTTENEVHKTADVRFKAADQSVAIAYTVGKASGSHQYRYVHGGLDVAGAIYMMRQLQLKEGASLCFDVYGIRRLWRMDAKVEGKEHVSLPLGEFDAWHLAGVAVRLDDHRVRREIHVWISADERRLPLVAVGSIDLGAVRATLTAVTSPGAKRRKAQGKETLKW